MLFLIILAILFFIVGFKLLTVIIPLDFSLKGANSEAKQEIGNLFEEQDNALPIQRLEINLATTSDFSLENRFMDIYNSNDLVVFKMNLSHFEIQL